jgi:hypothetical protein
MGDIMGDIWVFNGLELFNPIRHDLMVIFHGI